MTGEAYCRCIPAAAAATAAAAAAAAATTTTTTIITTNDVWIDNASSKRLISMIAIYTTLNEVCLL
jgi:hypothetical protein